MLIEAQFQLSFLFLFRLKATDSDERKEFLPTKMSSEMEAAMSLKEGSSQEDWENLFTNCSDARAIVLDSLDLESALACRLVCKEWRVTVNGYKKLRARINEVFSIAVNL